MALHTDTPIYKSTYSLSLLTAKLVANMPRNYKMSFGADFHRQCLGLVMRVYQANTSPDRLDILNQMRQEIEAVNLSLRLCVDLRLISRGQYGEAILITDDISKQATGWKKHTENAQAAGLSRQSGQRAHESGRAAELSTHRQAHKGYQRSPK
jgi:hypothetical protein